MICQLGLPTLFVTFTSVESKWTTLMLALHTLNKNHTKIPIFFNNELEYKHFIDLVRSNPITCAHYYNHQMATFCNLLKKASSIVGKVDDFYFVTKFQNKGSEHMVCCGLKMAQHMV